MGVNGVQQTGQSGAPSAAVVVVVSLSGGDGRSATDGRAQGVGAGVVVA